MRVTSSLPVCWFQVPGSRIGALAALYKRVIQYLINVALPDSASAVSNMEAHLHDIHQGLSRVMETMSQSHAKFSAQMEHLQGIATVTQDVVMHTQSSVDRSTENLSQIAQMMAAAVNSRTRMQTGPGAVELCSLQIFIDILIWPNFSSEVHMFFCDVISRSSELDSWGGHTMVGAPGLGAAMEVVVAHCGTLMTCQVREGNLRHNWGLYVFFLTKRSVLELGGGFKYFLFSPLFGEMIQFD